VSFEIIDVNTALLIVTVLTLIVSALILKLMKNKTSKISNLRFFIQIVAVFVVFMGLIIGPFGVSSMLPLGIAPRDNLLATNVFGYSLPDGLSIPVLGCYYASGRTVTCPIWQMQSYIFPLWTTGPGYGAYYDTGGLERLAIVFGTVIICALLIGRAFCGWLCPFGLYMDILTKIRGFFSKRHLSVSKKTNDRLSQSRYVLIAVFIILSIIFGSQLLFGVQLVPETYLSNFSNAEGGFVTNHLSAPFCVVCPMRPLCTLGEMGLGYMSASYAFDIIIGPLYMFGFYVSSINLIILGVITAFSLAYRRFWCRICPLGGLTALFSAYRPFKKIALTKLVKTEEKCTHCGVCKRVCPTQVTEIYDQKGGDVTTSGCMLCVRCVEMCPYEGALQIKFAGKTVVKSRNWLDNK
jgi:ferredoxin-type protein NapH